MSNLSFLRRVRPVFVALMIINLCCCFAVEVVAQSDLSLSPFSHERTVIDSGAAVGRNAAYVPLRGNGQSGDQIVGRFVPETGGEMPWQNIATVDVSGHWAGTLGPLSREDGWGRVEVAIKGDEARSIVSQSVTAGHVVAIWGQSELHRAVLRNHAALAHAPAVLSPDTLRITFSDTATDEYGLPSSFVHSAITSSSPVTAHMVRLSNALFGAAPDDKFHFISCRHGVSAAFG